MTESQMAGLAARLMIEQPGRGWTAHIPRVNVSDEKKALLYEIALQMTPCVHLTTEPQPMVIALAIERALCYPCAGFGAYGEENPANEDRCDFCTTHGHALFQPFIIELGPLVFIGDACDECSEVLRAA